MQMAQALEAFVAEVRSGFTFELIGEQAPAHADLAMDAPDGDVDAFGVEGLLPGEHVLVDAVHQRPVEIEQKHGLDAHGSGSSSGHQRPLMHREGNAPVRAPIVNRNSVRRSTEASNSVVLLIRINIQLSIDWSPVKVKLKRSFVGSTIRAIRVVDRSYKEQIDVRFGSNQLDPRRLHRRRVSPIGG